MNPSETTAEHAKVQPAQLELGMQFSTDDLWQQIWSQRNLLKALKRVERNKGAPGIDGMTTDDLRPWFISHWPETKALLDNGHYKPRPVRLVTIPKPGGGTRNLGVPTVVDRLVQQAILQVLTRIFDPTFSASSFGFRPKRSAHQAVKAAQSYIEDDYRWVIEVDLDKFFDRVHHDVLMARVARKINDKQVLKLIGRILRAGIMADGIKQPSAEGTPQGSPLSPLLANIMLDDLDKELETRGHRFVRYADDIRVFVKTKRAAERVLDSVTDVVEQRLKLKVNKQKSKVTTAAKAELLGFGFWFRKEKVLVRISIGAKHRLKMRLRDLTKRSWSVSMAYRLRRINLFIRSWMAYFKLADTNRVFKDLDEWLRRRIRQVFWKQWKTHSAKRSNLIRLGIKPDQASQWACSVKRYWRIAGSAPLTRSLTIARLNDIGLVSLFDTWTAQRAA